MSVNDDLADALTRHQVGLHRLSNATVRKVLALLDKVTARIVARLAGEMSDMSRARQAQLLDDLGAMIKSAHVDAFGQLRIDLDLLADYEADYQGDLFGRVLPVEWNVVRPSADQIIAAVNARPFQGKLLNEWYSDIADAAKERLRGTIRMGITEGRTIDQMVREVRGTRAGGFKDGILEVGRRQAEAVVRTATAHTANVARERVYERNSGLIKGVQWHSTLDGRTTAICRGRDGVIYPVGEGPRPPAHWNCRSSAIPVVKSLRELGMAARDLPQSTRASMNGQVAGDLNYSDWLRKQDAAFQETVLGKSKAKLFRDGGLSLDRFIDRAGNELTLEQLKRSEATAWTKAALN